MPRQLTRDITQMYLNELWQGTAALLPVTKQNKLLGWTLSFCVFEEMV
jgi:hypothetical protein